MAYRFSLALLLFLLCAIAVATPRHCSSRTGGSDGEMQDAGRAPMVFTARTAPHMDVPNRQQFLPDSRGTALTGRVVDEDERPITEAEVTVFSDSATTMTNSEGEFSLTKVRRGDAVIARKGSLVGTTDVRGSHLNIVVREEETFDVVVRDAETDAAVPSAVVAMWGYSGQVGPDGRLRIFGVRSNDLVKVSAPGYEGMVQVIGSKARGEYGFFLQSGIAVEGVLTDESGTPAKGAEISIRNISRSSLAPKIVTADDGTWRAHLAEGPHLFSVVANGLAVLEQEVTIQTDGGMQYVALRIPRGDVVSGVVTGDNNTPVPDAIVHTRRGRLTVDHRGSFRLVDVPKGGMDVWASSSDWASPVVRLVPPSPPLALRLYKTQLSGAYADRGKPVPDAYVMVRSRYGEVSIETVTDENGEFIVTGVPLGSYFVHATHRDGTVSREGTSGAILSPSSPSAVVRIVASD